MLFAKLATGLALANTNFVIDLRDDLRSAVTVQQRIGAQSRAGAGPLSHSFE
jgi:hypothetical protein